MAAQPVGPGNNAPPASGPGERHRGSTVPKRPRQRERQRTHATRPDLSPLVESFGQRQNLWAAEVGEPAARPIADALRKVIGEIGRVDRLHRQVGRQRNDGEPSHPAEQAVHQPMELGRASDRPRDLT